MMKPILFNTKMVQAILDGRKGATRRIIPWDKVNAVLSSPARKNNPDVLDEVFIRNLCDCRYEVGDILYVRETWAITSGISGIADEGPVYMADFSEQELRHLKDKHFRWRPSIHMPKDLARIFLRVTDVQAERLQNINADDAILEGVEVNPVPMRIENREAYYRACFAALWDTTIKPDEIKKCGWDANPWVWVIRFEQIEKPDR